MWPGKYQVTVTVDGAEVPAISIKRGICSRGQLHQPFCIPTPRQDHVYFSFKFDSVSYSLIYVKELLC